MLQRPANAKDFNKAIDEFVKYYNYERYHESQRNLTPAGVYFERDFLPVFPDTYLGPGKYQNQWNYQKHKLLNIN